MQTILSILTDMLKYEVRMQINYSYGTRFDCVLKSIQANYKSLI